MNVTVIRAGFLATVQDLGRTGYRQFGVSSGGALDLHAMRIANLLVGNDETARDWKSHREMSVYASRMSASSAGAAAFTKLRWHCVRFQPDIQRWFRREMNYQSLAHSRAVAVGLPYPVELLCRRFSAAARRICVEISAAWAVVHCAMATLFPSVK